MDRNTIKQVLLLVITAVALFYSGIYLSTAGKIKSLEDGLVVMVFFLALFPFLSVFTMLLGKLFKSFLTTKNY